MLIRNLEIKDRQVFLDTLSALSPIELSEEQYVKIFNTRKAEGNITIVAEIENEVVGTASYFIETKFIHGGGRVMHVEDVAVKISLQGKNIGRILMTHLETIAKTQDCYKIILDCAEHNISFYNKCGFYRHEIEMRKDIKP